MSKKVKLEWRKVKGEWRAGPFDVRESPLCPGLFKAHVKSHRLRVGTEAQAKRACERLASKILEAVEPAEKSGAPLERDWFESGGSALNERIKKAVKP